MERLVLIINSTAEEPPRRLAHFWMRTFPEVFGSWRLWAVEWMPNMIILLEVGKEGQVKISRSLEVCSY